MPRWWLICGAAPPVYFFLSFLGELMLSRAGAGLGLFLLPSPSPGARIFPLPAASGIKHLILPWLNTGEIQPLQRLSPLCWSWAGNLHPGEQKGGKERGRSARGVPIFTPFAAVEPEMINLGFNDSNCSICSSTASIAGAFPCWSSK